jgi:hypothetical protein
VAIDQNDNIFIGGVVGYGAVDFGGGALSGTGQQNSFVVKFTASGGYTWGKRFLGAGLYDGNVVKSMTVDRAGDVVMAGYFSGTTDFGGGSKTAVGGADTFLCKYSGANGSYQWSKVISSTAWDGCYGVATDPNNGSVVVAGTFGGSIDLGGGWVLANGGSGIYMARYSSTGAYQWGHAYGGDSGFQDSGNGVAVAADGRIALTGQVSSAVDFGGGWTFGNGAPNYFAALYNSAGDYIWAKRVLPAIGQVATFDTSGNLFTAGTCGGVVDFGGGPVSVGGGGKVAFVVSNAP